MSVPGQVQASNQRFRSIIGMPIEQEFAKTVKALPATVNGNVMCKMLKPCKERGQVIKFSIEYGQWDIFQISNTFSVIETSTKKRYAGGITVKDFSKVVGRHRVVVYDCGKKPIALAVQGTTEESSKTYIIYAATKIYETDKAEETEAGVDFYPWFRIRDMGEDHQDFRAFLGWNGADFQPLFRVVPAFHKADPSESPMLVPTRKGDVIVVDHSDRNIQYALLSKQGVGKIAGWKVCVAPGVDPLAMLTLAAVVDTMLGWFS